MKLTDTHLILLSSASGVTMVLVVIPASLKETAPKVVKPLLDREAAHRSPRQARHADLAARR